MSIQLTKHEAGKSRLGGASTWPPPSNASSAVPTSPPMAMSLIRQGDKFAHRHQTLPPSARFVRSRPRKLSPNRYHSKLSKDPRKTSRDFGLRNTTRLPRRTARLLEDLASLWHGPGVQTLIHVLTTIPTHTRIYRPLVWQGRKGVLGTQGRTMTSMATGRKR